MNKGKIILKGSLCLQSPLLIGSGNDDHSDRDVLLDIYGNAFIPATSFSGVIFSLLQTDEYDKYFGKYLAKDKDKAQSQIIFDDLYLVEGKSNLSIRDGIRIDHKKGSVADKAKFDFQVVEPGPVFAFNIEFNISKYHKEEKVKPLIENILAILEDGISIGAKSSSGFGMLSLKDKHIYKYDFDNKQDLLAHLLDKDTPDVSNEYKAELPMQNRFRISSDYSIPNSLIVRSYPKTSFGSDAVHLRSNGSFVLPATSVRGALRARAIRILNTIWPNSVSDTELMIESIFGFAKTDDDKHYSIPSSLRVSENLILNVESEMQNRVKIDRFTSGTIESALFDSMPVFPKADKPLNIEKLIWELKDPLPSQKALLILLLKDLYTGDLAIGGEKNVGRGTLLGIEARIYDEENDALVLSDFGGLKDQPKYENYLEALLTKADLPAIKSRLAVFKEEKKK